MNEIVLYEPEIPPNTGNIIRLCANTDTKLSLIEPLGFKIDDKQLKRAGLDYHDTANLTIYASFDSWIASRKGHSFFSFSTHGNIAYHTPSYSKPSILIFGPETRGLPLSVRNHEQSTCVRIPMSKNQRSLNLSNTVAIGLFEALRQQAFNYNH